MILSMLILNSQLECYLSMKKKNLAFIIVLGICPGLQSFSPKQTDSRRVCLKKLVTAYSSGFLISKPKPAISANLPQSNGADLSQTGSVKKLLPIVGFQKSLVEANEFVKTGDSSSPDEISSDSLKHLSSILGGIPSEEKLFKKRFDEYSDPVSYKQKYMDQNAFLVYYTNGFDGPGRLSIESGEVSKQTLQYGARNECWNSIDELNVEVQYALKNGSSSRKDILELLARAMKSFDQYLSLAPLDDIKIAKESL